MNVTPVYKITSGAGDDIDGSSDTTEIPNDSGGTKAKTVMICVSVAAYVLPVQSGGAVTASTGTQIGPNERLVLDVSGFHSIAYLQVAGNGQITISPVELR